MFASSHGFIDIVRILLEDVCLDINMTNAVGLFIFDRIKWILLGPIMHQYINALFYF